MTHEHSADEHETVRSQRQELLEQIDRLTDAPMVALSFVWLGLLILDLTVGTSPLLQNLSYAIWGLFIADFLLGFSIAPHKLGYLRRNWLTVISLLVPALRSLRVFRAFRVLRLARATRSLSLLRLLTSLNRGMRAIRTMLSRRGVGYVVALTVLVTLVGAAGMSFLESPAALRDAGYSAEEAREGLVGYGEALWWTAMIMTTMGSEYWPRTAEGRILGWLLSVYAFAIFGYITATIASYFVGQDAAEKVKVEGEGGELTALREELAALRAEIALVSREVGAAEGSPLPRQADEPP
jgi:voltage-gated potassium channel